MILPIGARKLINQQCTQDEIIIIIIGFIIVTCARHPADTTAYKSLIFIDVHLIISLHTKNMLPNLLTIKSTTMVQ